MASKPQGPGTAAIRKLERWLAAGHSPPRHRGRVNRAALCRLVGLTRSTLSSNAGLRALIQSMDLDVEPTFVLGKPEAPPLMGMEEEVELLREENAELRRQLESVAWLLSTGRAVRR